MDDLRGYLTDHPRRDDPSALGHESYVTTLTIYADYIDRTEGGKAVPLARPATPAPAGSNVVSLAERRRNVG